MKDLKFQILFFYYDRPEMSKRFALKSILQSSHLNWELSFIDDSTNQDGDKVLGDFFDANSSYINQLDYYGNKVDFLNKIKFYKTGNVRENGHSIFGKFANQSMSESEADISLMLCDDDALLQDYLLNLNNFYINNPDVKYSYCHLLEYDPSKIAELEDIRRIPISDTYGLSDHYIGFPLNYRECLNPNCTVDSTQVSWRRQDFVDCGVKFPFPQTRDLDASIYKQMFQNWGECCWNKTVGQYKGWFSDQLGKRVKGWHSEEAFNVKVS